MKLGANCHFRGSCPFEERASPSHFDTNSVSVQNECAQLNIRGVGRLYAIETSTRERKTDGTLEQKLISLIQ